MFSTLLIVVLVACVAADEIPSFVKPGTCANVALQDNFDLRKYAGRWYMTHAIDNPYLPQNRCVHSFYDYSNTDYGFKVRTAGFNSRDEYVQMELDIYPTKEFPAAHMLVDAPTAIASPYEVIETDYDNYSCVYSCITFGSYKTEFGFVYSRYPKTGGIAEEKCASVFNKNGIDFAKFSPLAHTAECVYRA